MAWPWLALKAYAKLSNRNIDARYWPYAWIFILCAVLFVGAFYLPDIGISSQTDTFQQHFVGGGMVCALLAEYIWRSAFGGKGHIADRMLLLLSVTAILSVTNEMLELGLNTFLSLGINSSDTWWDLLANTTGSIVAYAVILAICLQQSNRTSKQRSSR